MADTPTSAPTTAGVPRFVNTFTTSTSVDIWVSSARSIRDLSAGVGPGASETCTR